MTSIREAFAIILGAALALFLLRVYAQAETGMGSYYYEGQHVACGGRFNPEAMTAAHKTLPCGSRVTVTNRRSGKSVQVVINDRGPFVRGRIIDVSRAAARVLGMMGPGVVPVDVSH